VTTYDQSPRQLNGRDLELLQRLLSDVTRFPPEFWVGLVARLETTDMNLPISSIVGLKRKLATAGSGGGTTSHVIGGVALGLADVNGKAVIPYGVTLAAGETIASVVVTNRKLARPQVIFSVPAFTATDFTLAMWDSVTNAAVIEGDPFQVAWQALVTKL
jgi:hypothetical protein